MTPGTARRIGLAGALAGMLGSAAWASLAPVNLLDLFEPIRFAGLGGAGVALGSDSTLAPVNPAAAARLAKPALTLGGQRWLFNDLLGHILLAKPTERGTWFAGMSYYESAGATLRCPDNTVRSFRLQQDMVAYAGYARAVNTMVAWGVTAKVLRSELFEEFRTQAGSVDAGVQVLVTDHVKAGVAVRNLGPQYRYFEDALSPRSEVRIGVAGGWRVREGNGNSPGDSLILVIDGVWSAATGTAALCTGAEYRLFGAFAFRAGLRTGGVAGQMIRLSAGLGFSNGPYRLDYSTGFGSAFSMPHALALTLSF